MKKIRKNFTLFEMLISVGLLVILAVVLLRTLALTADYWKYSADQSEIYLNAKIVMGMLNDDISNMLYDKSPASNAKEVSVPLYTGEFSPSGYTWITSINDGNSKGWCLGMVSRTAMSKNHDSSHSNICKVAYIYYPPKLSGTHPLAGNSNIPGAENGVLLRGTQTENTDAYLEGSKSLTDFYKDAMNNSEQIADCIIEFRVDAFRKNASSYTRVDYASGDAQKGLTNIDALRLTMTMMPEDKLDEYRKMVEKNASADDKRDFIRKHGRRFNRTYWVNPTGN